jgi:hypothetical protein
MVVAAGGGRRAAGGGEGVKRRARAVLVWALIPRCATLSMRSTQVPEHYLSVYARHKVDGKKSTGSAMICRHRSGTTLAEQVHRPLQHPNPA